MSREVLDAPGRRPERALAARGRDPAPGRRGRRHARDRPQAVLLRADREERDPRRRDQARPAQPHPRGRLRPAQEPHLTVAREEPMTEIDPPQPGPSPDPEPSPLPGPLDPPIDPGAQAVAGPDRSGEPAARARAVARPDGPEHPLPGPTPWPDPTDPNPEVPDAVARAASPRTRTRSRRLGPEPGPGSGRRGADDLTTCGRPGAIRPDGTPRDHWRPSPRGSSARRSEVSTAVRRERDRATRLERTAVRGKTFPKAASSGPPDSPGSIWPVCDLGLPPRPPRTLPGTAGGTFGQRGARVGCPFRPT